MKPRNKYQKALIKTDKSIKPICKKIKLWAWDTLFTKAAVRLKSGKITCLECGGTWQSVTTQDWQDEVMGGPCPHCKAEIKIETTLKKNFFEEKLFTVIDTHKKFQVVRTCHVKAHYRAGEPKRNSCVEVSRIYIDQNGRYEIIGYNHMNSWYGERWFGDFSLKNKTTINNHTVHVDGYYPKQRIIPQITRNGYKGDLVQLTPWTLFDALLNDPKSETFMKLGQLDLLYFRIKDYNHLIDRFWDTLKVCFKQGYIVKNPSDYFDYLINLEQYGRDLKSPRYVCPINFAREHDRYVERKRKERVRKTISENLTQIKRDERNYKASKSKFFKLSFKSDDLTVEPIKTVKEVMIIGDKLRHCIYSSNYHRKLESLLFVAKVDNMIIETLEFSLRDWKIIQCRGLLNKDSRWHDKIIDLVESNIRTINEAAIVVKPKSKKLQILKSA